MDAYILSDHQGLHGYICGLARVSLEEQIEQVMADPKMQEAAKRAKALRLRQHARAYAPAARRVFLTGICGPDGVPAESPEQSAQFLVDHWGAHLR